MVIQCHVCLGKGHLSETKVALDAFRREVTVGWMPDTKVYLAPSPFAIMQVLVRRMPNPVHDDALMNALWGDNEPGNPAAGLKVHVCQLRKVIRQLGLEIPRVSIVGYALTRIQHG
jgi:DNA-binding response OmpR family regulator